MNTDYKYGFKTKIESETLKKGLSLDVIYEISKRKKEPDFILNFRLDAFKKFKNMKRPTWANLSFKPLDLQDISYYSTPKDKKDPQLKKTLKKLGISTKEKVALDFVFDSVSLFTTFQEKLKRYGIIFCSMSEAIKRYPEMIKKYLGSIVRDVNE